MRDRESVVWAAGLFEGEGCISGRTATITMTDHDVIRRFHDVVGFGHLNGFRAYGNGKRPILRWSVQRFELVQALIAMFWPWLGERRREQAFQYLMKWQERPRGWHLRKDHPQDEGTRRKHP